MLGNFTGAAGQPQQDQVTALYGTTGAAGFFYILACLL
jgi:hypothetical protein